MHYINSILQHQTEPARGGEGPLGGGRAEGAERRAARRLGQALRGVPPPRPHHQQDQRSAVIALPRDIQLD